MPQNTPLPPAMNYLHITGAGTVVAKSGAGFLGAVNINQGVSGATLTLVDNNTTITGGATIAAVALGAALTAPSAVNFSQSGFGVALNSGLVIISTGATIDATVMFK